MDIFESTRDYARAVELMAYYRFANCTMRYSYFNNQAKELRLKIIESLEKANRVRVSIFAYCLMPNHFHLLVRQEIDNGISKFISEYSNGYAKYFNTKRSRTGPLFQGPFRSVRVESDEQLVHVSRYIHLNPASSYLVQESMLDKYPWSSVGEYADLRYLHGLCDTSMVMNYFSSGEEYLAFVHDQVEYARQLEKIKHLSLEE